MTQLQRTDTQPAPLITAFSREQVDLIKRQYAKGASDDELKLFLYVAQSQGLDPLRKQIYFRKQKNGEVVHITSIDGYRLIADRTGKYAGNDDPAFDDETNPRRATVTVYKLVGGVRCPFTASARWDQYYPGDTQGFMWRKMPNLMLGKCAEALALRKAFPNELGGVYIKEEMDQAGMVDADVVEPAPKLAGRSESDYQPPPPPPKPAAKKPSGFDGSDAHAKALERELIARKVDASVWKDIADKMLGKTFNQLDGVVKEVCG